MSDRPHSLLIPHVRLSDTHGWIGTQPGCLACVERHGHDYAVAPEDVEKATQSNADAVAPINATSGVSRGAGEAQGG